MKRNITFLVVSLLLTLSAFAQSVAINTDGSLPNPNAILDVKSGNKGLLIPRMDSTARNAITPTKGLMVYDTTTNSFWYNTGVQWKNISPTYAEGSSAWQLTGNAGNADSNFLGTTDNMPLKIRVNNQVAGIVDPVNYNCALGYQSLQYNTTGLQNTATGAAALQSNKTGSHNTANGYQSLIFNDSGYENTATGYRSLFQNASGGHNTAAGTYALQANTSGQYNTALGAEALYTSNAANGLTATGYQSLYSNTSGAGNTGSGYQSLFSNTTGTGNTALGYQSLYSPVSTSGLTAVGYQSQYQGTGEQNTSVGFQTLYSNTTGAGNTATGYSALNKNTTGGNNSAFGDGSLATNSTGESNTAVGMYSMHYNINGGTNTAVGAGALELNSRGNGNVAIGYGCMFLNDNGSNNTAIGVNTFSGTRSGDNNTLIGAYAYVNIKDDGVSNSTALGAHTTVNVSNKVRIGDALISVIEGAVPFSTPSDGRYKFNIKEDVKGIDFIRRLRPVTYQFDVQRFDEYMHPADSKIARASSPTLLASYREASGVRRTGFIAQEVEKAAKEAGYDFSGVIKPKTDNDHYGLSYESFIVPLVKAVQEQQKIIDEQNKTIADLLQQLQEIKKRLNAPIK